MRENLTTNIKRFAFLTFMFLLTSFQVFSQEDDPLRRHRNSMVFLDITRTMPSQTMTTSATGFVTCKDGHVLTNYQEGTDEGSVIKGAIGSRDERKYDLDFIKAEEGLDLLLLKFKRDTPAGIAPVMFGNPSELNVGDQLYSLGFPLTLGLTYQKGAISSKSGSKGNWITDTPHNSGDSGGPVFNELGQVVAVVQAEISSAKGIKYIVPINRANNLLDLTDCPLLPFPVATVNNGNSKDPLPTGIGATTKLVLIAITIFIFVLLALSILLIQKLKRKDSPKIMEADSKTNTPLISQATFSESSDGNPTSNGPSKKAAYRGLTEAFLGAFPSKSALTKMLKFELGKDLGIIASGDDLEEVVLNLIMKAEAQGWLKELANGARRDNPKSPYLQENFLNLVDQLLDKGGGPKKH